MNSLASDPRVGAVQTQILDTLRKNIGPTKDTAEVEAQMPYWLSEQLTETVRELAPIFQLLTARPAKTETFEYPYLLHRRAPGSDAGIASEPISRRANIDRAKAKLKLKKSRLEVYDFIRHATEEYFDEAMFQMAQEAVSFSDDLNYSLWFDNGGSNKFAWNGFFTMLRENRFDLADPTTGLPAVPELDDFQEMLHHAQHGSNENRPLLWVMSREMFLFASALFWPLMRINQNVGGTVQPDSAAQGSGDGRLLTLDGGWVLGSLLGYPVLQTPIVGGRTAGTMPSITTIAETTGGLLGPGDHHLAVTKFSLKNDRKATNRAIGESVAAFTSSPINFAAGSTNRIRIQFPEDPYALYYRVYHSRTGAPGSFKPLMHVPAQTRDSDGNFQGYVSELSLETEAPSVANGIIEGTENDLPPRQDGDYPAEFVALLDLDEINGMGQFLYFDQDYGDDIKDLFAVVEQMPRKKDALDFWYRQYGAPAPRSTSSSVIMRNVRREKVRNPGT